MRNFALSAADDDKKHQSENTQNERIMNLKEHTLGVISPLVDTTTRSVFPCSSLTSHSAFLSFFRLMVTMKKMLIILKMPAAQTRANE